MDEIKKHNLTEDLKVTECEIHELRADIRSIQSKLNESYKYETELFQRLTTAREKTSLLHQQLLEKTGQVSQHYERMKGFLDVFTGNFFKHL